MTRATNEAETDRKRIANSERQAWITLAGRAIAWGSVHPIRRPVLLTPRTYGLDYRSFVLENEGLRLSAWHVPHPDSRLGVVLCHGHNDTRMQVLPLVRPLHDAGFHVLLFDHRAMGTSAGTLCTFGFHEHRDVLAATEWLRREAGVEQVGLFGASMGGASALLAAAADDRIRAVVTDCAFACLDDVVESRLAGVPQSIRPRLAAEVRHWASVWAGVRAADVDPESAVRKWAPRPLLVIHGASDRLVPPEQGARLVTAAGAGAEFWRVDGAGHVRCRAVLGEAYVKKVARFFTRHIGPCVAKP